MTFRRLLVASAALLAAAPATAQTLTLAKALERAEAESPLVAEARAGVEAARGRARQAGVAPNPEISVELENVAGSGDFRGTRGAEATVSVGQRLELGGKRSARRAVAAAELEVAELRLIAARAETARRVREAFADLADARARAALAQTAVETAGALARTTRILVEAGREPPLRGSRAEAAAAQAAAELEAAGATEAAAQRALSAALGTEEELAGIADTLLPPTTEAAADEIEPLDVRIARAEMRAAQARIALERTAATPDVTAQAGVRRLNETDDTALVVGLSAPIPLRDGNRGAVAAAAAETTAAEARLAQARLDASRALRDARAGLAAARTREAALSGVGITQAREALRLARLGYEAGKFGLVDVLDAQGALAETEGALLDARLARARAEAALARAAAR